MKGQTYVIIAVLIVLFLFLIRSTFITQKTPETFLYENYLDLRNELTKTIELSLLNGESVGNNLDSFISFSEDVYAKRNYVEDVTYSISTGTTTRVTIKIYLGLENSYFNDTFVVSRTVYS